MSYDKIKSHEYRKYKLYDSAWSVSGSVLTVDGRADPGVLDRGSSRYLSSAKGQEFYAFLSGSDIRPHYKVFLEEKRVGHVTPKDYSWTMPIPSPDTGDDD